MAFAQFPCDLHEKAAQLRGGPGFGYGNAQAIARWPNQLVPEWPIAELISTLQTQQMHASQVMAEMIDIANVNWALSPDDAIAHLAVLIDGMDQAYPLYEAEVEMLLRVGACIWKLQQGAAG